MYGLGRLLGVEEDEIIAEDLTPFFELLSEYIKLPAAVEEGEQQLEKLQSRGEKEGALARTALSYRYTHLKELMRETPRDDMGASVPRGFQDLLREYPNPIEVRKKLRVEGTNGFAYSEVESRKLNYLPIELDGRRMAFKFVCGQARNFVFTDELRLCEQMGWEPITPRLAENAQQAKEESGVPSIGQNAPVVIWYSEAGKREREGKPLTLDNWLEDMAAPRTEGDVMPIRRAAKTSEPTGKAATDASDYKWEN